MQIARVYCPVMGPDTIGIFPQSLARETTFVISCLFSCTPSEKGSILKRNKEQTSSGLNYNSTDQSNIPHLPNLVRHFITPYHTYTNKTI